MSQKSHFFVTLNETLRELFTEDTFLFSVIRDINKSLVILLSRTLPNY